ncbi:hypothetical protein [uncultured Pseudonocardia sp.]|nr:hypothetical protein [uncultured Pseudonocardia sp.]
MTTQLQRGGHPGEHGVGGHGVVQQQHTDQRAGPGPVTQDVPGRPRTPD